MESSEIEAFLTLAEELHFGRAADRLRLSQPRVSRLIATLERKVGGPLFERTSRQVTLTPLGKRLRDRLEPAWTEVTASFAEARDYARGTSGTLRLGWPASASGPRLRLLTETFRGRFPECELVIHDVPMMDIYGSLRGGEIDVLAYWLAGQEEPGLTTGPVVEYRARALAVGHRHRLAARESVSAEELADENTLDGPPSTPAAVRDAMWPPVTPSGRPVPRIGPCRSTEEVAALVASGRIVHPTVVGNPVCSREDIRLLPFEDLPPLPLGLIWRTADENARIRALADVARHLGPLPVPRCVRSCSTASSPPPRLCVRHACVWTSGLRSS